MLEVMVHTITSRIRKINFCGVAVYVVVNMQVVTNTFWDKNRRNERNSRQLVLANNIQRTAAIPAAEPCLRSL
jgi:hypothetical protein